MSSSQLRKRDSGDLVGEDVYCEYTFLIATVTMSSLPLLCSTGSKGNSETYGNDSHSRQQLSCYRGLQGCPRSYKNYHSYKKHMYKKHRDILELDLSVSQEDNSNPSLEDDAGFDGDDSDLNNPPSLETCVKDNKRISALFLLKATAVSEISKCALDDLISDISLFLSDKLQTLENDVTTYLRQRNLEVDSDLLKMFQSPPLTLPFQGLDSEFLRKKFYIDHLGMLV